MATVASGGAFAGSYLPSKSQLTSVTVAPEAPSGAPTSMPLHSATQ